jgi:hypothetical protein
MRVIVTRHYKAYEYDTSHRSYRQVLNLTH